ncbi:Thioredoxin superfamily protein [Hibiscus syriacus]|uniref:MLO-like protein n=1 Tax=Hibiscus syriacus TaxID=106335 RepID=A0A6A3CY42_HIBSY|nr:Thioredoxin superfamily protein [Hibiscus syriacus]
MDRTKQRFPIKPVELASPVRYSKSVDCSHPTPRRSGIGNRNTVATGPRDKRCFSKIMNKAMTETSSAITLEKTPTWAVAAVVFVLISISIFIEHLFHLLAKYFNKRRRKSLIQVLDKIKSELLQLGFISLLLTVSEKPIANVCIPKSVGETFLPCSHPSNDSPEEAKCEAQGKVSLLSREGVNELQYLIFGLAFFHSLSCVLTFSLGMAKMRRWESWESETRTLEYQFSNDPRRFLLINQTPFARRHLRFWSEYKFLRWPACFLRQFYASVSKVDYFTLRHGFITAHFSEGSYFDFQKYIERALEKDFGVVVGTSLWVWIFSMFFIFLNAHGFYGYLWLPFIPLLGIITRMCLESHEKSQVVRGTFLVKPSDHFFCFGRPKLLLHLMHLILFQNSFQLAFFTLTWYRFGLRSCFHRKTEEIVIRPAVGVLVQILCGYVTLPLYALVIQMGTSMKKAIFGEKVVEGLKRWRANARKNIALKDNTTSFDASPSLGTPPSFRLDIAGREKSDRPSDSEYLAIG